MKTLSNKNYLKIKEGCLYKKKPIIDNSFSVGTIPGTFHCKNWTFTIYKSKGRAWSADTYFRKQYEEITNDNVNDYEFIFDFNEVKNISDNVADEYEKKDLYCVATDSGGYSCGGLSWIKKEKHKSKRLLVTKKKDEIRRLKNQIDSLNQDLEKINNNMWYEKLEEEQ